MELYLIVFVCVISILFIIWLIRLFIKKRILRKEEEAKRAIEAEKKRQELYDYFTDRKHELVTANWDFEKNLIFKNGYFANSSLQVWITQYSPLHKSILGKSYKEIRLSQIEIEDIDKFLSYYKNSSSLRLSYNGRFLKNELEERDEFFNNIEGRKLDIQQRTAIINNEDNNLVIAGAGSGKTTTIVGKVNYLLDRYKINPREVLLISFTNKSAASLRERIGTEGIEAKTFHKFGKDVIVESEKKQPSIFDEDQFSPLIKRNFYQSLKNETYLKSVTEFFQDYLKPHKSQFEFDNHGDYIQYLKDYNFKSYKSIPIIGRDGLVTYKREVVKSIEECRIANFLLFNGINYEYEYPYEYETATETFRQYKPDFSIIREDQRIYIEHFGIARNGDVPSWFNGDGYRSAREKYHVDMEWKRKKHFEKNTILIETYSYEMSEGILFDNLTEKLIQNGITLKPKTTSEIWEIISEASKEEVNSVLTLFLTFINLMKSNNYSIADLTNKNSTAQLDFLKKRNASFINIIKPIYDSYENHLRKRGEIDFNDMINIATKHIEDGIYAKTFKYIIIDEFQDISIGRYKLIKALKDRNPECKMFCVGDDWQSIYRFTGSDIALFKDFEKYFGFTIRSRIETTYRFHEPLISLSSSFILKNPNQSEKKLIGITNDKSTAYNIVYSFSEIQDDTSALISILGELATSFPKIQEKEIMILGRYGFDIDRIKNDEDLLLIDKEGGTILFTYQNDFGKEVTITMRFLTVHKSKGLEADIVIILNCNSGKFGFPAELSDDLVLNLLLSEADQFENGEERRLFYVAMSRAKELVYFIADSSYKSKFIVELEGTDHQSKVKKCPLCLNGDVILRKTGVTKNGNDYKFFGCSNYLHGCEYHITEFADY